MVMVTEVKFIEDSIALSELSPGEIAVSVDREKFYVCAYRRSDANDANVKVIINMNYLQNEYPERLDLTERVRKLIPGDKFICTR